MKLCLQAIIILFSFAAQVHNLYAMENWEKKYPNTTKTAVFIGMSLSALITVFIVQYLCKYGYANIAWLLVTAHLVLVYLK